MKLLLKKQVGLLKEGETLYNESAEQTAYLIDNGFAVEHPEADPEPVEMKRVLYKDENGNYRTKEVPVTEADPEIEIAKAGEPVEEEKPKRKQKAE